MRFFFIHLSSLFLLLGLSNCARIQTNPLEIDKVPHINVLSVSPTSAKEFEAIEIEIEYKDGDGDLGEENPDTKTLSVKDSRLSEADLYHIQPLVPSDKSVAITGKFKVKIKNVFIFGNANSEQITFSVKLKDRAGNWSNEVKTATVTVSK